MDTQKIEKKRSAVGKLPSGESIEKNKGSLAEMLLGIVEGKVKLPGQQETVTDKLKIITDIFGAHKQNIESGILSYTTVAKAIEITLQLKVSPATLRAFCQGHLGFEKSVRPKADQKKPFPGQEKIIVDGHKNAAGTANELTSDVEYD